MASLTGKVIMISGASKGLGKETALLAAKMGAKVAICSRDGANIQLVAQSIEPEQVYAIEADVSREEDVETFIQGTMNHFGGIDILINNAATFAHYTTYQSSLDIWQSQLDNNVTSAFLLIRGCLPIMRAQKSGRILSLTSSLARQGAAGFGGYAASKAALEALTFSVEEEEYIHGITAVVFNPGVMKTDMQSRGDDPKEIAPILLDLASKEVQGNNRLVTAEEWAIRMNSIH